MPQKLRYKKISIRIWIDEKFASLSDDAKLLWFYLLTNPNTVATPGLYRARAEGMAADLGWTPERFLIAFSLLTEKEMAKADWRAGVVWIPNAPKHNPPENPNVVKAWIFHMEEIPECPLKQEAIETLQAHTKGFGILFRKGLANQEQEQEQEQEQKRELNLGQHSIMDEPNTPPMADLARKVLLALSAARKVVNPRCHEIRPTASATKTIRARLEEGYTVDDCYAVINQTVAECASNPEAFKWLNENSPFTSKSFRFKLDMAARREGTEPPRRPSNSCWSKLHMAGDR